MIPICRTLEELQLKLSESTYLPPDVTEDYAEELVYWSLVDAAVVANKYGINLEELAGEILHYFKERELK